MGVFLFGIVAIISSPMAQNPQLILTATHNASEQVDIHIGQKPERTTSTEKTLSVTISPKPLSPIEYVVSFFSPEKTPITNATSISPGCGISFSVQQNLQTALPGETNIYTATLENKGQETCTSPSFSVYYDTNESVVSTTPKASGGNYYWKKNSLASNEKMEVVITVNYRATTPLESKIKNEMCATADNATTDICVETFTNIAAVSGEPLPPPATTTPPTAPTSTTPTSTPPEPTPTSSSTYTPSPGKEFGTWIWESPIKINVDYIDSMMNNLEANGFNALYITIDDYLDIAAMDEGSAKEAKKDVYFRSLSNIVSRTNQIGVAVDVEGGWRDWAITTNRWKGHALIDFVKEYNTKYPSTKVRGLQFDVEPYLLPTYEKNKASVLKTFIGFMDEITTRMQTVDAKFSIVIPHFYDSTQKWTPAINYNGKTKYTHTHLLDIMERKPGSAIIIMSYRNFFNGSDGTRQISEAEIKESTNNGYATQIIVAQETGDVSPDYVTFYGMKKTDVLENVNTIHESFKTYNRFGGVSIHYFQPFLGLD